MQVVLQVTDNKQSPLPKGTGVQDKHTQPVTTRFINRHTNNTLLFKM